MRFLYISPSILPSRTANSVHVVNQCAALGASGVDVTLLAKRLIKNKQSFDVEMRTMYGDNIVNSGCKFVTFYNQSTVAVNVRIALLAVYHLIFSKKYDVILSRNLYAAFIIGILLHRSIIFETHQLESGFRRKIQRLLLLSKHIKLVVISKKLKFYLEDYHKLTLSNTTVLHDSAPDGIIPVFDVCKRKALLIGEIPDAAEWSGVCGYFGHLYAGRGIEVIEDIARLRPNILFLIYGGNPDEVAAKKEVCKQSNIRFMGHVPHPVAQKLMTIFDVLLMPYQKSVSIGIRGHDTAGWMSPMKMFEYLASGVPLISSDLPVLREVLTDKQNCLLVQPDDPMSWVNALDSLLNDAKLTASLGRQGHDDYLKKYTWPIRAQRLLKLAAE